MVVFWKQYETEDRQTGKPVNVPVLRYYRVFNALAQCAGLDVPDKAVYTPSEFTPSQEAERIIAAYTDGPAVHRGGSKAYYRPLTDEIHIPEPTRFATTEDFYSTLFHEHAHGTGHAKRLDRKLAADPSPFGSTDYGKEELVAEMASAFLCGQCGLSPAMLANQAAYLEGWRKTLKQDRKLIVASAGAAQKAADWILGERGKPAE